MKTKFFWVQVWDLTIASLKSRYRKTFAGFIWVVLNPLLMFGVQSLVFKHFMRIEVPDYYLFLLGGLLPWIFFSSTIQMATPLFVAQSYLLRSFKINPMVIIGAQILDNFINFLASLFITLIPFYLFSGHNATPLLLLPLALLPLLIGTLALSITLSILNVFYRDTNFVMGFVFSLLFYLTPIFYPKIYVPEKWHWMVDVNPIVYLLEPFRRIVYFGASDFWLTFLQGISVSLAMGVIAYLVWKRKRNVFYHKL